MQLSRVLVVGLDSYWRCHSLLETKTHGYATADDAQAVFRAVAEKRRTSMSDVILTEMAIKMERLHNLARRREQGQSVPRSESLYDTLDDFHGYAYHLEALWREEDAQSKEQSQKQEEEHGEDWREELLRETYAPYAPREKPLAPDDVIHLTIDPVVGMAPDPLDGCAWEALGRREGADA